MHARADSGAEGSRALKIATWNVNSVRARLPRVLAWLEEQQPDLLGMQEIKARDEDFPVDAFREIGYHVASFGQPTLHGVALAGRVEIGGVERGLIDDAPDAERRLIGGRVAGIRIITVYVPNGTEVGSERFAYKLAWLRRLRAHLEARCNPHEPILVCGDFNVAPEERDVHDPDAWRGQILFHPDEHKALQDLMSWGLVDAFRRFTPEGGHYTWWDYRAGAFHRGWGLRIDLMLMTEPLV
ncbi:MAG: exodeoxyribonuclease III, partial [Candidatus Eisenbacteria bacterium]